MRVSKTTVQSFLISLIVLGIASVITGAYIAYVQRRPSGDELVNTFLIQRKVCTSTARPPEVKEIIKPALPKEMPASIEDAEAIPRLASAEVVIAARAATVTVLEFRNVPAGHHLRIKPNMPKVRVIPEVTTRNRTSRTASEEGMVFSASVAAPTTPMIGRGMADEYLGVARDSMRLREGRPIVVCGISAKLADVDQSLPLVVGSKMVVKPLPKGEPGGCVVGRGRDIRGVFRMVRLRHDLADWWADQSSLVALTEWLNTQTRIRTDMNVEGGSIRLTDPKLSKAPLVFFTGHDASLVISRELTRGAPLRGRLSKPERDGLRKYLIEDRGFIFFDDCGVNAPSQAFLKLVLAQLRYAVPEYGLERIPNDHEIYNNYYKMNGPPIGYDIFWWGTHPPKRKFLEGITIDDHLGALMSRRDYMCSMRTISAPSWPAHYSPGVFRFSTNVVIYALTHGGISDYSHYAPEDKTADTIPIKTPVVVPAFE